MIEHHFLAEAMRRHGQTPGYENSRPRTGLISSYDPKSHAVKVLIQPENIESNWMPLGAIGVGNGWGVVVGPQIGDQVTVLFSEGNFSTGVIVARSFSVQAVSPEVKPGEILLQHASGSLLKFNEDGSVNLVAAGPLTSSAPTWNHTGDINVTGTVTATTDVIGGGKSLKNHTHGGVRSGGDTSGPPA